MLVSEGIRKLPCLQLVSELFLLSVPRGLGIPERCCTLTETEANDKYQDTESETPKKYDVT